MLSVEERRNLLQKKAQESNSKNPLHYTPPEGESRIRLLPPIDPNDPNFYTTHAYHYFPINKGIYVYTPREFIIEGKRVKDPVDEAVDRWYKLSEDTGNKEISKLAWDLKRKRHYFAHIMLLQENDPEKKYRVLVDRSSKAHIMRFLCQAMGLPFVQDIKDNWVDKDTLGIIDGKRYYDLLDMQNGHDVVLIHKKTGNNAWDINYVESFVMDKPRAMTDDEKKYLDKRVDLEAQVEYVEGQDGYNKLVEYLQVFMDRIEETQAVGTTAETPSADVKNGKLPNEVKQEMRKEVKDIASNADVDELLDQIAE